MTHPTRLPLCLAALLSLGTLAAAQQVRSQSLVVTSASVTGFTLIDADTNQPVRGYDPIPSGAVLDLNTLPRRLNIRANTAGRVGSVRFGLDKSNNVRTEGSAPYSLCSDQGGRYNTCGDDVFGPGGHTLTATPYVGANAGGASGPGATLTYTVTRGAAQAPAPALSVTSFTLIDVDTNRPVPGFDPIPAGVVLRRTALPRHLNIRANVGGAVGSVTFAIDGRAVRPENEAPFALCSDTRFDNGQKGKYLRCDDNIFAPGRRTLVATPYSEMFAKGNKGAAVTYTFTVER